MNKYVTFSPRLESLESRLTPDASAQAVVTGLYHQVPLVFERLRHRCGHGLLFLAELEVVHRPQFAFRAEKSMHPPGETGAGVFREGNHAGWGLEPKGNWK